VILLAPVIGYPTSATKNGSFQNFSGSISLPGSVKPQDFYFQSAKEIFSL
jgi:hypothetical protein